MGLNLETLIGILVILILLILADGVRRMIKERQGRLRMRIDPRYRDAQEDEPEKSDYNPELIGSARVIRRAMEDAEQDECHGDPREHHRDLTESPRWRLWSVQSRKGSDHTFDLLRRRFLSEPETGSGCVGL